MESATLAYRDEALTNWVPANWETLFFKTYSLRRALLRMRSTQVCDVFKSLTWLLLDLFWYTLKRSYLLLNRGLLPKRFPSRYMNSRGRPGTTLTSELLIPGALLTFRLLNFSCFVCLHPEMSCFSWDVLAIFHKCDGSQPHFTVTLVGPHMPLPTPVF